MSGWDEGHEGLHIEELTVEFDRPIIRDLTLTVPRGTILSLVGPSGCGKTTLLRTIAGLNRSTGGQIVIDGEDVTDLPAQRRQTGLVFEEPTLFPGSVRENIAFGLDDARMSERRRDDLVDIAMAIMNITGLAGRMPHELSGGQGQRVSLARTIVRRPRVLLLDEPVAHVEVSLRQAIHADIQSQVTRMGMSAIYVTHDIDEACMVGDRIAVMNEGRIVQVGRPRWVYNRPASRFVANFMGVDNIIPGVADTPSGEYVKVAMGRLSVSLPCAEDVRPGPVTVVVTPESIVLHDGHRASAVELEGQVIAAGFARSHMVYHVETNIGTLVVREPATHEPRAIGTAVTAAIQGGWVI